MKIEGKEYRTIWFDEQNQVVKIIDQTKLPHQFIIKDLKTVKDAINAIKVMDYREARKILGKKIIGVTCHNSKKLIKKAIKNKASYIALGAFFPTKTKLVKYRANIKTLKWAKKTTNIPIVAIGGIKFDNYNKLLLNKANFLAISSYIWNNKKYKPLEAINKLK